MRSLITPFVSRYWSSDAYNHKHQTRAFNAKKKQKQEKVVQVFLALDDPYSYLLVQVLPLLETSYDLDFKLNLIHNRQMDMFPESDMWSRWAIQDAAHLKALYHLDLPQTPPSDQNIIQGQKKWLQNNNLTLANAFEIFRHTWAEPQTNQIPVIHNLDEQERSQLLNNEINQKNLGHYFPATLFYAGTWYWELDRLDHFETTLQKFFPNKAKHIQFNRTWCGLFKQPENKARDKTTAIQLYFSLRSTYSHLALINAQKLAKHYNVPLELKPVLPMLMRGLSVPKNKTSYIFMDTVRESKKLGIPYGNVADPLGKGVENGYAIWQLAKQQGKELDFFNAFSYAVNSQGISANYHGGLKKICKTANINWQAAKACLQDESWRQLCENNLQDMYTLGLWGVPSLSYKDKNVWGQDRLFVIENALLEQPIQTA